MKHPFLFVFCLLIFQQVNSQHRFSIQPEAGAGVLIHRYTRDSLVPSSSKGNLQIRGFGNVNIIARFTSKNNNWQFLTGLGYMSNSFVIKKENGIENFVELFTFAWLWDDVSTDPYPYNIVLIKNKNLVIPLGFMYNSSNKNPGKMQTLFGLRTNLNFSVNKKAFISFASASVTDDQKKAAEKQFTSLVTPVTVSLMPTITFKGNPKKKWVWDFTLIPIIVNSKSQLPRIYKNENGFSFSLSAAYTF